MKMERVRREKINWNNFKCEKSLNMIDKCHDNLMNRRKYLIEKITTMEKSMPLIMAYNICMSNDNDNKLVVKKIQDIVNELLSKSNSNTNENIIEQIKNNIDILNTETETLYEKIIETDMKLEESNMTLESIQVINNELNDKIKSIDNYSIEMIAINKFNLSDKSDLNCVKKLCDVIKKKIRLKCCINALENRENCIRTQFNRVLTINETNNDIDMNKHRHRSQTFSQLKYDCNCTVNNNKIMSNNNNNIVNINTNNDDKIKDCNCYKSDDIIDNIT